MRAAWGWVVCIRLALGVHWLGDGVQRARSTPSLFWFVALSNMSSTHLSCWLVVRVCLGNGGRAAEADHRWPVHGQDASPKEFQVHCEPRLQESRQQAQRLYLRLWWCVVSCCLHKDSAFVCGGALWLGSVPVVPAVRDATHAQCVCTAVPVQAHARATHVHTLRCCTHLFYTRQHTRTHDTTATYAHGSISFWLHLPLPLQTTKHSHSFLHFPGATGSLIHRKWVLTAAHCYYPARTSGDKGTAYVGVYNRCNMGRCGKNEGAHMPIKNVYVHRVRVHHTHLTCCGQCWLCLCLCLGCSTQLAVRDTTTYKLIRLGCCDHVCMAS